MQLFLGAVPIILRLFSKARGHLLFSNYSRNNLPKPSCHSTIQLGSTELLCPCRSVYKGRSPSICPYYSAVDLEAVQDRLLLDLVEYKPEVDFFVRVIRFLAAVFTLRRLDDRFNFFGMIVAAGLVQSASVLIFGSS